jgi:STE24 endopeptidase
VRFKQFWELGVGSWVLTRSPAVNEDKSVRYHRLKRRAAVASVAVSAAVPAALLATGGSVALRDAVAALAGADGGSLLTVALYAVAFLLLHDLAAAPLSFYSAFRLERRYGLSSESFLTWLADHVKAAAITLVLGVAAVLVVYAALRLWPGWWWLASAVVFMLATAVMAVLFPIAVMPLFYRFTALERPALRARLEALSLQAGVPVLGVFEWGLGEKTRRANAALVGWGGTRRILLSDTLLADYTDDEIEVVLAHEMAHHVHRDILKGLGVEFVLLLAAGGAAAAALARWWGPLGLGSPADVAGLPLLLLAGGAVMLAAAPLVNALSRWNEHRADHYAIALTGRPEAFVSAMRRLAAQNLAEPEPSKLALWLFHSHPPIAERIARAGWELTRRGAGN